MIVIVVSCFWILGILCGFKYHLPILLSASGLIPIPFIFILKRNRKWVVTASFALVAFFAAAGIFHNDVAAGGDLTPFENRSAVELQGMVTAEPEIKDNVTHLEFTVERIKTDSSWRATGGTLLLFVNRYPEYHYGDVLWLRGTLESPPVFDSFDYQAYLGRQGIYATMLSPQIKLVQSGAGLKPLAWIYDLRERLSAVLAQVLPEPQAALCQGILLGIRTTIPQSLNVNLSITGTTQLLAISGINLTIITGILVALGIWLFGRRHYYYVWLALLMVWFYSLLTGMQAPVVRSAIMASLFLAAELLGRQKNAMVALTLSAAVMAGINPQVLWDVSFQLSYLAMAGLMLIAPPFQELARKTVDRYFGETGAAGPIAFVGDSFAVTAAVLIAVWPLIAYYFNLVSVVSPFANLLVSPALPAIMLTGGLTALAGLVSLPLAQAAGWTAWVFLSYMIWMVNAFASLPLAAITTPIFSSNLVWLYYAFLTIALGIKSNYRKLRNITEALRIKMFLYRSASQASERFSAVPKKLVFIPLFLIAFLTSFSAATLPDSQLHAAMLDVGGGDAVLVQNGGQNILIDGGPGPQIIVQRLSEKLPFWDKTLDLVVLTNPGGDHITGLVEVLKRYQVKQVLASNFNSKSPLYKEWLNLIKTNNIPFIIGEAGQTIELSGGAQLKVLNSGETEGLALRLSYVNFSLMLASDMDLDAESALVRGRVDLNSTVLKVGNHGQSTSTSLAFLKAVKPQLAVISAGSTDTAINPQSEVASRLGQMPGKKPRIYSTDRSGSVEFVTDGRHLSVKTDR